jgi:hypothetical protein
MALTSSSELYSYNLTLCPGFSSREEGFSKLGRPKISRIKIERLTKDNYSNVYGAEDAKLIGFLEKTVFALRGGEQKMIRGGGSATGNRRKGGISGNRKSKMK